ncbi:Hypothetical predicted protein [Marmota monax]|uniref:Uncharacterized protein n=1 Tax=Marmota monax TaxID=9995 RepID=A0A5E4B006_MARMO|nr:hypothetical protein GHT09_014385 [Marmota monax]VTJ63007.1 Hypothetical predicted protein [Marmota monax]
MEALQNQGTYQPYFVNLLKTGEFHKVLGCRITERYPYPHSLSFHVPNVGQVFVHVGEFRNGKRRAGSQTFPCTSFYADSISWAYAPCTCTCHRFLLTPVPGIFVTNR